MSYKLIDGYLLILYIYLPHDEVYFLFLTVFYLLVCFTFGMKGINYMLTRYINHL